MAYANRVQTLTRRAFPAAGLQLLIYQQIGGAGFAGFENACFMLRLVNASNVDVNISYNGSADHDYLRAGDTLQIESQTNSPNNSPAALFPIGTKVFVSTNTGAGMGTIYLTGYFLSPNN